MKTVGFFTLSVSDPYPVWVTLERDGKRMMFSHRELSDLKYLVEDGIKNARLALGEKDKEEV